jgi:hypothetical protein
MDSQARAARSGRMAIRGIEVLLAAAAASLALLTGAGPAGAIPAHTTFGYTGGEQEYTVPSAVTMLSFGTQGGGGGGVNSSSAGAGVNGFLPATPGQTLYVEVGAEGQYGSMQSNFGGGAPGGTPPPDNCIDPYSHEACGGSLASQGGGASDVRTISRTQPGTLASRVIVAAGGGGNGGGGNTPSLICGDANGGGGSADNSQPLPEGNAEIGPLPIKVATGTIIPGYYAGSREGHHTRLEIEGVLDAGPGTDLGGVPGEASSCSEQHGAEETVTAFEALPGLEGSEGAGGGGANAGGLAPAGTRGCTIAQNNCANAGAGGGGGGGYFGGGGGATGYNRCSATKQECNDASNGHGGAAGSSFLANGIMYPYISLPASKVGSVTLVPLMEIASPASGANYSPGSVVHASWECTSGVGYNGSPQIGGCKGTKAPGEAVDTSRGIHTFTVSAFTRVRGEEKPISSTITYTALEAPTVTKVKPANGPVGGGTTVTITGTNFEDVTAVSFGGTAAASFKVESATTLKAVVPASAAGKVDVRVTTGGGTSAVSTSDHFSFLPTVTSVAPAEGPTAGGTTVTVTGTGFAPGKTGTLLKFGTVKGTFVECASSTSCTVHSPAHAAGTVDVKATVNKVNSAKATSDHFTYV